MDVSEMQKKLSLWATENPTEQRRELYNLLCNEVWLRVAHHQVSSNQGRETAGVDGESMSNFNGNLDGNLETLRQSLKAKTFEPLPVRRVYIPKPHSEKKRPLGIPGIRDRIVQEALRMILEPIWEADFSRLSYGFRPNRSTYDAISYLSNRLTGRGGSYQWIIEGDITSYFDTIPQRRLMKAIKKRVADTDIRDLLWQFLRAGVMYRGKFEETPTGTPQGGIISPLLANIYLHELDRYMESTYLDLDRHEKERRRKKGIGNFLYVRYADDFIVLNNGTKAEAYAMKEELKGYLSTMGLTLSEEKTKITHITEGFNFLGYQIIRKVGESGKMVPKVLIPESATKRFCNEVRRITAPGTTKESTKAKMIALNMLTRGWCNYYRCTNYPSQGFSKPNMEVFWGMAHWLGKKYQISMPVVMQKYLQGHTLRYKDITLIVPEDIKARKRLVKAWHNPYTAKEAIIRENFLWYERLWSGHEDRHGEWDRREEVIQLKGTVCVLNLPDICESKGKPLHPSEVEIDHIILRAKFKDPKEANRMSNLQPVCTSCHRAKTKTDLKVLSRMR